MSEILIYSDIGVSDSSLKHLKQCFKDLKYPTKLVSAKFLTYHHWEKNTSLLIFPGGMDRFYHEKLKGSANVKILSYVEKGGNFLGICAGGYYGAAQIEFEKGYPLEICDNRELGFFPGKAVGPAYGPNQFRYHSEQGVRNALLEWGNQELFSCYFNGGCFYPEAHLHSNVEVLATYTEVPSRPAAVIRCRVKKGLALLSGVHPEYPLVSAKYSLNLLNKFLSHINH